MNTQIEIEKLKRLPSLKKSWVRLVHRCNQNQAENIKENGLIFNRNAAKCTSSQRGGTYNYPSAMVSVYNEDTFWQSIYKDDFSCYDNANNADTKLIFDMPIDEFSLLQTAGRLIKGKIDSKFLVGRIANINGKNKDLVLPAEEINKTEQISRQNPSSSAQPNNVEDLIDSWCANIDFDKRKKVKNIIYTAMHRFAEDLKSEWNIEQNNNKNLLINKLVADKTH